MSMAIDYSQWQTWEDVTTPSGGKYKRVPGTGYVYDPFLSSQKKRPVLWLDPTKANEERAKIQRQAEQAASPLGQAIPIVAGVGGTVGAKYAIDALGPTSAADKLAQAQLAKLTGEGAAGTAAGGFQAGVTGAAEGAGAITANTPGIPGLAGGPPLVGGQVASSPWSMSGIGSAGNYIAPIAGGIGALDLLINQRTGTQGYLQGAGSGAAIGSYFGPIGAGIGAGLGLLAGGLNEMFDTNEFKTEGNRLAELRKKGVFVPEGMLAEQLKQGRSKEELVALERSKGDAGNVKFAESRNEADLRPQDIVGYAAFAEKDPDWFKKPLQERLRVAQEYLSAGAVREDKGSIDLDDAKYDSFKSAEKAATKDVQPIGKEIAQRMDRKNKRK